MLAHHDDAAHSLNGMGRQLLCHNTGRLDADVQERRQGKNPIFDEDGKLHDDDGNKTPDDDDDDCAEALPITSADGDVSLSGGWYFVEGDVYIHGTLKFTGDTHLILCDGAKLTVTNTAADGNGINCTFHIHKSCIKTQL